MKRVRLLVDSYDQGDETRTRDQVIEVSDPEAERLIEIGAAAKGSGAIKTPNPSDELASLSVAELDERLEAADLPKSGNKQDKLERLREADTASEG